MVTVQQIVRHELGTTPVLLDMMQQGLLNISSVAEKFRPKVEEALSRGVKETAVSMAVRRVAQEFSQKQIFRWKFPANLEISTKSNIYEVAVKKESRLAALVPVIVRKLSNRPGMFFSVMDGTYETMFLTNQPNKGAIKKLLKGREITSERDDLGYVSVNFEPYTKDIPGIYYQITRALAFNNVSIVSFHTIGAEMIILFKRKDLMSAYRTMASLLEGKPVF